ncbi:MFS transporter [Altererythrobacter indicus]|uniref:MFS transporter n=2 Tax=Altericroceibacterium indicum TaxID=374177 RepID=A0A845ABJ5_9SPHN|nr:MFS transporter [Altericroceibacterium indicum]
MLLAANSLAFVDRQALALMLEPIKQDFGASDTAMSFVYGISFTAFYIAVGIPLAWLADRSNRRNIVMGSILCWSLATTACGLARNLTSLFLCRLAVGAGESGLSPSAYSLLADYFPRDRLASALGIYQAGIYLGGAMALFLGGAMASIVPFNEVVLVPVLGELAGWQIMFILLGFPGFVLSALFLLVREPFRRGAAAFPAGGLAHFAAAFRYMGSHKWPYLGLIGGFTLIVFTGNATGAWIPTFLQREHGMSLASIGQIYGAVVLSCGMSGAVAGGFLSSGLQHRKFRGGNLLPALIGTAALIPLTIGFPLMPTPTLAFIMIAAMNFFAGISLGGGMATILSLTPNNLRGQITMIYIILINLVGASLGPLAVALITDFVFHDPQRLAEAIAMVCAVSSPLAFVALLIGIKTLPERSA